jgi:hypothetical protein
MLITTLELLLPALLELLELLTPLDEDKPLRLPSELELPTPRFGSLPSSLSSEQERVNAKASTRAASLANKGQVLIGIEYIKK